jgi:hypothetical protein
VVKHGDHNTMKNMFSIHTPSSILHILDFQVLVPIGLAILIIEKYVKAKRRIMETQIFHHAKIYLTFKKKSSKRNQNPLDYYNSITNLKFQHKPKYHP